jgi:hypothetical protein
VREHFRSNFTSAVLASAYSLLGFSCIRELRWQSRCAHSWIFRYRRHFLREVLRPEKRWLKIATLLLVAGAFARAQTPEFQPEVDVYLKVNSLTRVYFQAQGDRDEGVPIQSTLGPSVQLYFKPLVKLKKVSEFDLDDSKQRPLVVEAGYRYITAPNEPTDNRFMPIATSNFPIKGSVLITDRNRADLDWKGGTFHWRYRNRLTLTRTFAIDSYHLIPHISAEPYYTSQYAKWSTTELEAGCLFPVGKHVQFDAYYEHENNTGKKPNQQVNYIGLTAHFLFSRVKK